MLFSDESIVRFIGENFEAAWQSVRPVPTVRVDFGAGHAVTRTLHGNIATYVCLPDGTVLDVLPGLYQADAYRDALERILQLHASLSDQKQGAQRQLLRYHHERAQALAAEEPGRVRATRGFSISARELPTKGLFPSHGGSLLSSHKGRTLDQDTWARDTRFNETIRRPKIHEFLAQHSPQTPGRMTKWLYREVLDADLDDPYLGLKPLLFKE